MPNHNHIHDLWKFIIIFVVFMGQIHTKNIFLYRKISTFYCLVVKRGERFVTVSIKFFFRFVNKPEHLNVEGDIK